ncbi:recombinase family protein [Antarcticirhabdus aurantiaca]|uniref:Recombinase family protein n=1 Tax=Antarcticirhabdus aurantiaca TaxID=2606717 RepID=A0ACD4NWI8_9HYPH|nr:recombinase family protein [Antarcticirhabdus aurantiaca]WAJ31161.1 recombinase family protein [Jeongeuplla avenae]
MAKGKFVAYYRVSTARQGASGLGLEAQQEAVRRHLNGGSWSLVAEVIEIESGRKNDRPKLAEAIRLCRIHGATLLVAKLDRLARNVAFVSALMEAGIDFIAVDFPQANRLTIHVLAAVAEHEATMISQRTKDALQAAKARGVKLGGNRGSIISAQARQAGRKAATARAKARAADLMPIIEEMRLGGATSLGALARGLMDRGIPTARGGASWTAVQVSRVLSQAV